jgi:hypothetical protein
MGRRIEAAGLAKTAAGSVRDGMKLVMVASRSYVDPVSTKAQTSIKERNRRGEIVLRDTTILS